MVTRRYRESVPDIAEAEKIFRAWEHPNMQALRALKVPPTLDVAAKLFPFLADNQPISNEQGALNDLTWLAIRAKALGASYKKDRRG